MKEYYKKYYEANKQRIKKYQKENRGKIKLRARDYYQREDVKEKKRISERKYYKEHPERKGYLKLQQRKYRALLKPNSLI